MPGIADIQRLGAAAGEARVLCILVHGRNQTPEDMQAAHGFAPLGSANGPVKSAVFGGNNARLYGLDVPETVATLTADRFSAIKAEYLAAGPAPSNRRYGYVARV